MKRIYTLFFALLSVCTFSTYAAIIDGTCGTNLTWTLNTKDSTLTISGTGSMTNYSSTAPWYDYRYRSYIKYVTIEDGVTSIGENAFRFADWKSVTLGNNVTITVMAFEDCSSLTSITIPNSVTSIGRAAFSNCSKLTSITIPNSVTSIGDEAFDECSSLTSITIPNSVTSIGYRAFKDCSSLTSITIPNSVTRIGGGAFVGTAFYNNPSNWDKGVLYIDNCLIAEETSITGDYNIKESTRLIAAWAFAGCSKLESITIPNSVTSIGEFAFAGCDNLTSITIPEGVRSIGWSALEGTSYYNDESNWENGVLYIGDYLIKGNSDNLSSSYTIKQGTKLIADQAFEGCKKLKSVTIPNSVKSIGRNAFRGCSSLTSITIPESVTSIRFGAFWKCKSLSRAIIPNDTISIEPAFNDHTKIIFTNPNIAAFEVDGIYYKCLAGRSNEVEVTYRGAWPDSYSDEYAGNIVIPSKVTYEGIQYAVTSIGDYAFDGCTKLTFVLLPSSVVRIGVNAFNKTALYNNKSNWKDGALYVGDCLIAVKPNKKVSAYVIDFGTRIIAGGAFRGNKYLRIVSIPSSITSIGRAAFQYCSNLTSVVIPDGVTSIEALTFDDCFKLTSIKIPSGVTTIGSGSFWQTLLGYFPKLYFPQATKERFAAMASFNTQYPPEFVEYNDGYTSTSATQRSATPPATLSSSAQAGSQLNSTGHIYYTSTDGKVVTPHTKATFGANIVSNTYENGQGVITFDKAVISIGKEAFRYCRNLKSITIPNSVTSIEEQAFWGCKSLTFISIPNSVKSIGDWAFFECSSLSSINIPNSVTSIGENALRECTSLTSITIPSSVTSIGSAVFWESYNLTSIIVEDGNTTYDSRYNCNAIIETATNTLIAGCQSTIIPDGVTAVKSRAFADCKYLRSITIPYTVKSVDSEAFWNCSSLTSITVEDGNTKYDSRNNCNAIIETATNTLVLGCKTTTIPYGVTSIKQNAFIWCTALTSIHIPNSVRSIEREAFWCCSGLTSVTIPNSVTSIGKRAFWCCSSLKSIRVEDGNAIYDSRNNCNAIIETATNTLVLGCQHTIIPNTVRSLGESSFSGCSSLTSIHIPNSVMIIGDWAISRCSGLTSVTIPNSVTSIGENAFYECEKLTTITIPNSVRSIGKDAFKRCNKLKTIYIPLGTKDRFAQMDGLQDKAHLLVEQ